MQEVGSHYSFFPLLGFFCSLFGLEGGVQLIYIQQLAHLKYRYTNFYTLNFWLLFISNIVWFLSLDFDIFQLVCLFIATFLYSNDESFDEKMNFNEVADLPLE